MIKNVVIVEDDRQCADKLSKLISRFFDNAHLPLSLKVFNSSLEALEKRSGFEDLYFLDINLPHVNGMELAKKIREKDEKVIIIFCSNLAQFALKGYEVGAFDYIVKPFDYSNIAHRLKRALNVDLHRQSEKIIVPRLLRLAQKGRAAGVHVILATQRPDSSVINGTLKGNMPTRIAFRTISNIDSRIILDQSGAERLAGNGDGLYLRNGAFNLERVQSPYISIEDIKKRT